MAERGPGLGGIVSRPTISSYDRSSLTPGMRNVFDGLAKAGFGDISVNSGFRSATANAKARGAKSSQHLTGNAADFNFGGQPNERKAAFVDAARSLNVNGLGFYGQGDSIHLDTRQGAPVAWGVGGSFRRADPRAFPGFIQPNVTSFYNRQPVTQPPAPIAGPVNAYAPEEAATVTPSNLLAGRSRMPGAASRKAASGYPGAPSVPAAPDQPGFFSDGGWLDRNKGLAVGGLIGTAAGGPLGGLLGGILGDAVQDASKGALSTQAKDAFDSGWDGFSAQQTIGPASYPGMPNIPAAPKQPGIFGEGGWVSRNQGGLLGGLLGTAALGPAGGIIGGLLGNAISEGSKGTPSNAARAAMNAGWDGFSGMSSGQSKAARGTGNSGRSVSSAGSGGGGLLGAIGNAISSAFGGSSSGNRSSGSMGFSSGASGPDGGKVGGSSSSSSSGSKSGSSGSKSSGSSSSGGKKK